MCVRARACFLVCVRRFACVYECVAPPCTDQKRGPAGYDNKDCSGQISYSVRQVKISVAGPTGQVVISFFLFFFIDISYFKH